MEFRVRLFKADGTPESGNVITRETRQIEIVVSVLGDKEYKEWLALWNGAASEPEVAREFRVLAQKTYSRRIYIDDRSLLEDTYD